MRASDRQARLTRAKQLGRLAYDVLRFEDLVGIIEIEGEDKYLREFAHQGLSGSLLTPRSPMRPDEFSRIQIRHLGRKVLELRWSKAGDFRLVTYEPGEWEELLDQLANVF
ncbi:hypothetical protein QA640_17625 [Bradyrhizobium sp. CB82]|uniref:hypothetical protein n=1 Tax=Bradyrhizobium sp. CB82 TaxID=3039159 RepID=UPI0024B15558|nr:hypothetical protein [Bradyrhizobium sp. CB82]WFU44104.1 hypothetical protein QA640_17625 [Bradyrhizobium sp. CB82]